MAYYELTKSVRITTNLPNDSRYLVSTEVEKNAFINEQVAFVGLQVYVSGDTSEKNGLWMIDNLEWSATTFGSQMISGGTTSWKKISSINEISDIGDVSAIGASSNDILVFNGTNWVNSAQTSSIDELDDIGDVSTSTASSNDILVFNGTDWVNSAQTEMNDLSAVTFAIGTNILTVEMTNGTTETTDLSTLVDTDSYVCGGTYNAGTGVITFDVDGSGGATSFDVSGFTTSLAVEDLSNAVITNVQADEALIFDGTNWVNSAQTVSDVTNYLDPGITSENTVGGIATSDVFPSGTTFQEMWENLLMAPETFAAMNPDHSATLSASPAQTTTVEVGTYLDFDLSSTYTRGYVRSGDYPTHSDIFLTGEAEADANRTYTGSGTITGVNNSVTHTATTSNSWTVSIDYTTTAGTYYTSRGNIDSNSTINNRMLSTNITKSLSITGKYYMYIETHTNTDGPLPTLSSETNALLRPNIVLASGIFSDNQKRFYSTSTISWNIPAGKKYFAIYLPASKTLNWVATISGDQLLYVKTSAIISDANGDDVQYYKYEMTLGANSGYDAIQPSTIIIS